MYPLRLSSNVLALALLIALPSAAQVNVLTAHNDNARTGLNSNETILSPVTVSSNGFGKIFSQPVDGPVYAQPLYVSGLSIPNQGTHNVVFVVTMHDSVYAFDADNASGSNAAPLWHTSFINPAAGTNACITTDATDSPGEDCHTFGPGEIGIVGTPVIDPATSTLYVVARTKEPRPPPNGTIIVQNHRLHALDITTGTERPNSPVIIDAVVPGTGVDSVNGSLHFNQKKHIQRPALLLVNGVVYVAFCSYCDLDPYHGWIMGYDAQTLQQVGVFNVTPNATRGGIWMGGAGLAADNQGAIYCVTGNGTFDTGAVPTSFGDSFLKLTQGVNLALADYFTPYNQSAMDVADDDLGSSGAILLPVSAGSLSHPRLMLGSGKLGKMYLVDRDNMGHFNPLDNSQIVQEVALFSLQSGSPHFFGAPAFFNGRLYIQGVGEHLKSFAIANALMNPTPVSQTADIVSVRGATPSISANGTNSGIAWEFVFPAALRAYDADDLSQKLYDSSLSTQAGLPDQIPSYPKFAVPTIVNGKVYIGTGSSLTVFGLRTIIKSVQRTAGVIHLTYTAPIGIPTVVQVSSDFATWTDLGPGTPTGNGAFTYDITIDPTSPPRFYRVQ